MDAQALKAQLESFTGTEHWYQDPLLPGLSFTDGVKFFLDETHAVEVLLTAFQQGLPLQEHEPFLCLQFIVDAEGVLCHFMDGNYHVVGDQRLPGGMLPPGTWEFWMERGVLYLPSEH